jgi:hypothetical protein
MPSSGMWSRVDLVWTDDSEEYITSIFRLQPPVHASSSLADFSTLKMEAIGSSESSVHTRSTRRHFQEDGIFHSHSRENHKSYIFLSVTFRYRFGWTGTNRIQHILESARYPYLPIGLIMIPYITLEIGFWNLAQECKKAYNLWENFFMF